MDREEKLFDNLMKNYYKVTEIVPEKRASFVMNLASKVWRKVSGEMNLDIIDSQPIAVRGTSSESPASMMSIGNERMKIFIDKTDDSYLIIVKLIRWEDANTCILLGEDISTFRPIERNEAMFEVKSEGRYRLIIRDSENGVLGDIELEIVDSEF